MSVDLKKINECIADRSNVFYWVTDRKIEVKDTGDIWQNRHRYFNDDELFKRISSVLPDDKLVSIVPRDPNAQTNLGSQSSVRVGQLESGKEIIIRCNPRGIKNGYFHAESAAASIAKQAGLPSYDTLAIHDFEKDDDFAFQVIEKLPGYAVQKWLEAHPQDEEAIVFQMGLMMANIHKIEVEGYGPFNNDKAKDGRLIGLHDTHDEFLNASLESNLKVLMDKNIITDSQKKAIIQLFNNNPALKISKPVLVHNDYADWNLLTDGKKITGIIDWDECVGGDPVSDIACWSVFFKPERLKAFLNGYWQIAEKTDDFDKRFELLRLRYVISKMTLRLERYSWDSSDFVKELIEAGKAHLVKSMKYFEL